MYACEVTDHNPTFGGKSVVLGFPTRKEATWYGEHEVSAAKELFTDGTVVTFRVTKQV